MSSQSNIFPGPIAPENNPPINPEFFQPSVFYISNISTGTVTNVTTSVNHNYVVGQNIRLLIPFYFGSRSLNNRQGLVISIPSPNQIIVDINSTQADPFIPAPAFSPTPAQIIAIGDNNSGLISNNGRLQNSTNVPGSFINISPL